MNSTPEGPPRNEIPPKLKLKKIEGWYYYGRIPYKIRCYLNEEDWELLNAKNPGAFEVTADLPGPGSSLSIWIHKSVPGEFKDVILFHELTEAEFRYAGGLDLSEAHQQSVVAHTLYAQAHLSKKEFEEFKKWQQGLEKY